MKGSIVLSGQVGRFPADAARPSSRVRSGTFPVIDAARANSALASSCRPSFARR
jgi:hypothetical protein